MTLCSAPEAAASGNPVPGARPGWFDWRADCGEPPSYPSDGDHFLRLNENTVGSAGQNDEVSLSWYAPPNTSIVAGGGYTRMPNAFNQGWRGRFWGEDWGGGVHNILLQGAGVEGTGELPWITKNTTSIFASHLWPFGGWDDYKRFVFGLACVRPGGCDRANFNAVDAHSITLVVDDRAAPQVSFEDGAIVRGEWVRGYQVLAWREYDEGSGLRFSRLGADGATFPDGTIDYGARGDCKIGYRDGGRELARAFSPAFPVRGCATTVCRPRRSSTVSTRSESASRTTASTSPERTPATGARSVPTTRRRVSQRRCR